MYERHFSWGADMGTDLEPTRLGGRLVAEWVIIGALVAVLVVTALVVRSSAAKERAIALRSSTTSPPAPRPSSGQEVPRVRLTIAPEISGDVRVTEVVTALSPLISLNVRLPPPAGGLGIRPQVVDLGVEVGDLRIGTAIPAARGHATLELPGRSTEVRLTYVLLGATSQDRAAPDGRALVQVRPLSYDVGAGDGLVTTEVAGVIVHNLVCPDLPVDEQLCGRESGGVWRTTDIPADSSTVVAQVDLPAR